MISTVFFDNDGVLVDTEHLYMQATRTVLADVGLELSELDYVELFMRQNRGLLHFCEAHGWLPEQLCALRDRRNALYAELLMSEPLMLDGVEDALERLAGRARLAIVTSSRRDHFEIIHARTGLLRFFDFALTAGDYPEAKPHPAPYLTALARTGVDPSACLVVEDSERGLTAACAAGLRCLVVPSRLTRGAEFPGAWRVVDSVREIVPVLDAMTARVVRQLPAE